jgi:hypothetical protein
MSPLEPRVQVFKGNWGTINTAAFSADGRFVALGRPDSKISLVDTVTKSLVKTIDVSRSAADGTVH